MRKAALAMVTITIALASCPPAALAAGMMQPGLWEMSIQSDAMKNMPKMSPEQLEMLRQKGVNVPSMQDGKLLTRVCISKEMAERDQPIDMHRNETGCQAKNYQRSGTGYTVDIACDSPRMKGEGRAKGNFLSKQSFNSSYDFKGTIQGRPVSQHQESTGKWLADDCGSVKPMPVPK